MTLTCPECGFSREVPSDRLPSSAARVTCPRCAAVFSYPGGAARQDTASLGTETSQDYAKVSDNAAATGENLALRPKAGFWMRAVAALIDVSLVSLVQTVLGGFLGWAARAVLGPGTETTHLLILTLALFNFVLWQTYKIFFTGYCGQTPGKMALRIQVVRQDGAPVGFPRAFARELVGKFISGLLLGLGFLMVAFDAQKQGLHDRLAATYVIKL
ncbi:RDD family protein [Geoalkalibacter halelectricus]|uniref:Zinc-ribbon domain-containing protein n=1 Tax=Geoalkalibacter halelectricus TaxID=2847045 RepID=A0ABY5ZNW1_9BACT|nr:RDD family protein [Geoalkalibacter halelectricus]MDO3377449.1 zinc-ribbon domain-containing protein [Geoalkalibacter halelectricus]UWZ80791.1 zinc-ribbon domain-containing protein [Geoalkalibacter halelectricus]